MLVELILIPALFLLFSGWGALAKCLLHLRTDSPVLTAITGMMLMSAIACIAGFFSPLGFWIELPLIVIGFSAFLLRPVRAKFVSPSKKVFSSIWFWIIAVMMLSAGSFYPYWHDHYMYYLPTLRWLDGFGLLLGSANVDWYLGQCSFFHILQAAIDETVEPYARLGLFVAILYLYYAFEKKAYILLLALPYFFLLLQTTSSDIPVVLFSIIIVCENLRDHRNENFKLNLLLASFVFVIKPIAVWLPVLILLTAWKNNRKDVLKLKNFVSPSLLVILFIIKNIVVSSCIVYPFTFTNLPTSWQTDGKILEWSNMNAKILTYDFYFEPEEIEAFTIKDSIINFLTLPDPQTAVNYLIFITAIVFFFVTFKKRKYYLFVFSALLFFKLCVVYYISGQYRMMFDIIFPAAMILLSMLRLKSSLVLKFSSGCCLFAWLFLAFPDVSKLIYPHPDLMKTMMGFDENSLLRPSNYIFMNYNEERIGNLDFNIPNGTVFNCDTPQPAITRGRLQRYGDMQIFPQWRDPNNHHRGLYMKDISKCKSENLQMEIIISKCK